VEHEALQSNCFSPPVKTFSPLRAASLYSLGMTFGRHASALVSTAFVASLPFSVARAEAGPPNDAQATRVPDEKPAVTPTVPEAEGESPAVGMPRPEDAAARKTSETANRSALLAPACALPRAPVYVSDWDRLASLTEPDFVVGAKAAFWAKRGQAARWIAAAGIVFGGGAATLGTFDRLTHTSWTDSSKWSVAGGLTAVAFSLFVAWAFGPDRDDMMTVINQWNLRHPDRPLAP
jgi:hypothetical protein